VRTNFDNTRGFLRNENYTIDLMKMTANKSHKDSRPYRDSNTPDEVIKNELRTNSWREVNPQNERK